MYVRWLAEEIRKRSNAPIIVGGLLADLHHDLLLTKGLADYCVIGEGEVTLVELLENLKAPHKVRGVAFMGPGGLIRTEPREFIKDLDGLPMPECSLWNMPRYTRVTMYAHDNTTGYSSKSHAQTVQPEDLLPNMTVLSGRGCPYKCRFCARSYDFLRLKSVERITEEIKFLKATYNLKAFHFADELVIVGKKRTQELCNALKDLDLYWDCQAQVNTVTPGILRMLKDANCLSLGLGIESGSNDILKRMRKGVTREQSLHVLQAAKDVGIHLKIQLMGSFPGETRETLRETMTLMDKADLPPRRLTWTMPPPGSTLYDDCREQGLIPDEEAYIIKLHTGYNAPNNVILNVSGQSDEAMIRLFDWVHMQMYMRFVARKFLQNKANVGQAWFWRFTREATERALNYYTRWFVRAVRFGKRLGLSAVSVARGVRGNPVRSD